jgi:uncharacterized membrane protein YccC
MNPRLGAALRLAITIVVVDLAAIPLFPQQGVATFASFAVIAALYFLDFDGSWKERAGGLAAATLVALAGIIVGSLVVGNPWVTFGAALVVAFIFGYGRSFRGFIARSAIGVQLAFLLAVVTPAKLTDLPWYLCAWLGGSAVALVASLVLFPRYHSGVIRRGISEWAESAARLTRAWGTPHYAAALEKVSADADAVLNVVRRNPTAMGTWSKRQRSLGDMLAHIEQVTSMLRDGAAAHQRSGAPEWGEGHARELAEVTAGAFAVTARAVLLTASREPFADLREARRADMTAAERWAGKMQAVNGGDAVDALLQHNPLRVLSLAAEALQDLAARSQGWPARGDDLELDVDGGVLLQMENNASFTSVWFVNALRTGIAVAAAITIAQAMGLQHGIWVVMATLAAVNVSLTIGRASKTAGLIILGSLAGIVFSALLVGTFHEWWMFAVLLPFVAFAAKWFVADSPAWGQFSFTPFAIVTVAVLSWPVPVGLLKVRLEDVVIGVLVALGATLLTFPFGVTTFVRNATERARKSGAAALVAHRAVLTQGPSATAAATETARTFQRESAILRDALFAQGGTDLRDSAWILDVLLAEAVMSSFAGLRQGQPLSPLVTAALDAQPGIALSQLRTLSAAAGATIPTQDLIMAVWVAWWLDRVAG